MKDYIEKLKIEDIPWQRLTGPYGRVTQIPVWLEKINDENIDDAQKAFKNIANNIEHQSTLWQATPFAVVFLMRFLDEVVKNNQINSKKELVTGILDLFTMMANEYILGIEMEHEEVIITFAGMLEEKLLWPVDEENDEELWEESGGVDIAYYYYPYQTFILYKDVIETLSKNDDKAIAQSAKDLLILINTDKK